MYLDSSKVLNTVSLHPHLPFCIPESEVRSRWTRCNVLAMSTRQKESAASIGAWLPPTLGSLRPSSALLFMRAWRSTWARSGWPLLPLAGQSGTPQVSSDWWSPLPFLKAVRHALLTHMVRELHPLLDWLPSRHWPPSVQLPEMPLAIYLFSFFF